MAGPYKFTMLWNFLGSGFSESWYYNKTGDLTTVDYAAFDALAGLRDSLTAQDVNMIGYRASDLANPRNTYVKSYSFPRTSANTPDVPTSAWLAVARGPGGRGRRQFWMRGMPDAWISFDTTTETWTALPGFTIAFNAFVAAISQAPWAMRVVTPLQGNAGAKTVTGLAANPNNSNAVLTVDPTGFDQGLPIIVSGFKKTLGKLNGTYLGYNGWLAGSTTITLTQRQISAYQALGFQAGPRVRQQAWQYVTPTTIQLVSPRERRVGRAFGVPRGRRSVAR